VGPRSPEFNPESPRTVYDAARLKFIEASRAYPGAMTINQDYGWEQVSLHQDDPDHLGILLTRMPGSDDSETGLLFVDVEERQSVDSRSGLKALWTTRSLIVINDNDKMLPPHRRCRVIEMVHIEGNIIRKDLTPHEQRPILTKILNSSLV
jgi:hypothetical protein